MSIIQEFLQQSWNIPISSSLPVELSNIVTAYTFMMEYIEESRPYEPSAVVAWELENAEALTEQHARFMSQIDRQAAELDILVFLGLVVTGQADRGWIKGFLEQKSQLIQKTFSRYVKQAVRLSGTKTPKSSTHKYTRTLEQITSIVGSQQSPAQQLVIDAQHLRNEIVSDLKIGTLKQAVEKGLQNLIQKVRITIDNIDGLFIRQLEQGESNHGNAQMESYPKKQESKHDIDSAGDPEQQKSIARQLSQSRQFFNAMESSLGGFGRPRFNYVTGMY